MANNIRPFDKKKYEEALEIQGRFSSPSLRVGMTSEQWAKFNEIEEYIRTYSDKYKATLPQPEPEPMPVVEEKPPKPSFFDQISEKVGSLFTRREKVEKPAVTEAVGQEKPEVSPVSPVTPEIEALREAKPETISEPEIKPEEPVIPEARKRTGEPSAGENFLISLYNQDPAANHWLLQELSALRSKGLPEKDRKESYYDWDRIAETVGWQELLNLKEVFSPKPADSEKAGIFEQLKTLTSRIDEIEEIIRKSGDQLDQATYSSIYQEYTSLISQYQALAQTHNEAVEEYNTRVEKIPELSDLLDSHRNLNNPDVQQEILRSVNSQTYPGTDIPMTQIHRLPERERGKAFLTTMRALFREAGYELITRGRVWGVPDDISQESLVGVINRSEVNLTEARIDRLREEISKTTDPGERFHLNARLRSEERKREAQINFARIEGDILSNKRDFEEGKETLRRIADKAGFIGDPVKDLENRIEIMRRHSEAMTLDPTTYKVVVSTSKIAESLAEITLMLKLTGGLGLTGTAASTVAFGGRTAIKEVPGIQTSTDLYDAAISIGASGLTGYAFGALGQGSNTLIKKLAKDMTVGKKALLSEATRLTIADYAVSTGLIVGASTTIDLFESSFRDRLNEWGVDVTAKPVTMEGIAQNAAIMAALRLRGLPKRYEAYKQMTRPITQARYMEGVYTPFEKLVKQTDQPPQALARTLRIEPDELREFIEKEVPKDLPKRLKEMGYNENQIKDILTYKRSIVLTASYQTDLLDKPKWKAIKEFFSTKKTPVVEWKLTTGEPRGVEARPGEPGRPAEPVKPPEPKTPIRPLLPPPVKAPEVDKDYSKKVINLLKMAEANFLDSGEPKPLKDVLANYDQNKENILRLAGDDAGSVSEYVDKLKRALSDFEEKQREAARIEEEEKKKVDSLVDEIDKILDEDETVIPVKESDIVKMSEEDFAKSTPEGFSYLKGDEKSPEAQLLPDGTIRLSSKFFELSEKDRLSTLQHERSHPAVSEWIDKHKDSFWQIVDTEIFGKFDEKREKWYPDYDKGFSETSMEEQLTQLLSEYRSSPETFDKQYDKAVTDIIYAIDRGIPLPDRPTVSEEVVIPDEYADKDLSKVWGKPFDVTDLWKEILTGVSEGKRFKSGTPDWGISEIWYDKEIDRFIGKGIGKLERGNIYRSLGDLFADATGWGVDASWTEVPPEEYQAKEIPLIDHTEMDTHHFVDTLKDKKRSFRISEREEAATHKDAKPITIYTVNILEDGKTTGKAEFHSIKAANKYIIDSAEGVLSKEKIPPEKKKVEKKPSTLPTLEEFKERELAKKLTKGMSEERRQQIISYVDRHAEEDYIRMLKNQIALGFEVPEEILQQYPDLTKKPKEDKQPDVDPLGIGIDASAPEYRAAGYRVLPGNVIVERSKPLTPDENMLVGKPVKLKFAATANANAVLVIVDLDDIHPSHLNDRLNPKNFIPEAQKKKARKRDADLRLIAQNVDPVEVTTVGLTPYTGAPSINIHGEVIAGHGRSTFLKYMYEFHPEVADNYRKRVTENANEWGIDPKAVEKFGKPGLFYLVDVTDEMAIILGNYDFMDLETGGTQRMEARSIVRRLSGNNEYGLFLDKILSGEGVNLKDVIRRNAKPVLEWLRGQDYISSAQYITAFSGKGDTLTKDAISDLEEIITYRLFEGARDDMDILFEQIPYNVQAILIRKSKMLADPDISPEQSILPDIQKAVIGYNEYKLSPAKTVEEWLDDVDVFEKTSARDRYSILQQYLIEEFNQTTIAGWAKKFEQQLVDYTSKVKGFADLFPTDPIDKSIAVKEVFGIETENYGLRPEFLGLEEQPQEDKYPDDMQDIDRSENERLDDYLSRGKKETTKVGDLNLGKKDIDSLDSIFKKKKPPEDEHRLALPSDLDSSIYSQVIPVLKRLMVDTLNENKTGADLVKNLVSRYGNDIKPYLKQFITDIKSGEIKINTASTGGINVSSTTGNVERDSRAGQPDLGMGEPDVSEDLRRSSEGLGTAGTEDEGKGVSRHSDTGVSADDSITPGKPSDKPIYNPDGTTRTEGSTSGDSLSRRRGLPYDEGASSERKGTDAIEKASREVDSKEEITPTVDPGRGKVKFGDLDDIKSSLPYLFPEQQEDVKKAEDQFFNKGKRKDAGGLPIPDKGFLFTNDTGTGKTLVGSGVVKRFLMSGRENILVVVPSQEVVLGWKREGNKLGIEYSVVEGVTDKGKGASLITYANMRVNEDVVKREFDLVVFDESHNLLSNQKGEATAAMAQLKLLGNVPSGAERKVRERLRYEERLKEIYRDNVRPEDQRAKREELDRLVKQETDKLVDATKVLMLSATPFNYVKNLGLADGLLYNVDEGMEEETEYGYNRGSRFEQFLLKNFGYRMRYNKLTVPETGVDNDLMERNFHERLVKAGVLSNRSLVLEYDYSREFIPIDTELGRKIDKGIEILQGYSEEAEQYRHLREYLRGIKWLNYLRLTQLMESIKAKEGINRIQEHLDLGRKVLVYHTYKYSQPDHPFDFSSIESRGGLDPKIYDEIQLFKENYPELIKLDLHGLSNPIDLIVKKYGENRVGVINGDVNRAKRRLYIEDFNDDKSGLDVLVLQMDAGKEGISLHDTTGNKPRVTINLGLPIRPTQAVQIEGRTTNRIGTKSNSAHEYWILGLNFEAYMYGSKISERVGTPENLAKGAMARILRQMFIDGYKNPVHGKPSLEQGKGGKALDANREIRSPYDEARAYYWMMQKRTTKDKSREGIDFFPTPPPIGYKMVEWGYKSPNQRWLEPSAGDGEGIGRFFPKETINTFIEPSYELFSRLGLFAEKGNRLNETFEQLHIHNKFHRIVMNPPFGHAGAKAMDHLEKAATKHLSNKGRIIAILPQSSNVDKRLDNLLHKEIEADPVENAKILFSGGVLPKQNKEGKIDSNLYMVAEILLPTSAFQRAGTSVSTKIVIIDKSEDPELAPKEIERIDLSDAKDINDLFDRLEHLSVPRPLSMPDAEPPADQLDSPPGLSKSEDPGNTEAYIEKGMEYSLFQQLNRAAKSFGGRYAGKLSNGKRGFVFKTIEGRDSFLAKSAEILGDHFGRAETEIDIERKTEMNIRLSSIKNTKPLADKQYKMILEDQEKIAKTVIEEIDGKVKEPSVRKLEGKAKSNQAKDLIKNILKDNLGSKYGIRSIMTHLYTNLPVEVRERSEQLTRRNPSKYAPRGHYIRTKSVGSLIVSHEVGHAIYQILKENNPSVFKPFKEVLLSICDLDHSQASARNEHEGFAEWVRRFIGNPESIKGLHLSNIIIDHLKANYPDFYDLLSDTQLAVTAHLSRSMTAQFRSFSKDTSSPDSTISDMLKRFGNEFMFTLARGWGIEKVPRSIAIQMKKNLIQEENSQREALEATKEFMKDLEGKHRLKSSYHDVTRITANVLEALHGKKGLRVIGKDGNYISVSDESYAQIKTAVGKENWDDFEIYNWAAVSLDRWLKRRLHYPGYASGVEPEDLAQIVKDLETLHPEFPEMAKRLKKYYDGLIDIEVMFGKYSEKEGQRIKDYYDHYVPLRKENVVAGARSPFMGTRSGHSHPRGGSRSAYGSLRPIMALDEATKILTHEVISSYYWNKLALSLWNTIEETVGDKSIPDETRRFAGRLVTPLRKDLKVPAHVTPHEQRKIIAEYLNKERLKELKEEYGEEEVEGLVDLDPITADDIDFRPGHLPLFRAVPPRAVNIIAPFDPETNQRLYLQVNDWFTFNVFAITNDTTGVIHALEAVFKPALDVWKKTITSSLPFGVVNLSMRNPQSGVFMGEGVASLNPFYYTFKGILGKHGEEKILGETFGRILTQVDSQQQQNYWNQIVYELAKTAKHLKHWEQRDFWEKFGGVVGLANEVLLKPVLLANTLLGFKQFSLWGEEAIRYGCAIQAREKGATDSEINMAFDVPAGNFGEQSGWDWLARIIRTIPFGSPQINTFYRHLLRLTDPLEVKKGWFRFIWTGMILSAIGWVIQELLSTESDNAIKDERPEADRFTHKYLKGLRVPFYPGLIGALESFTWNTLDEVVKGRKIHERRKYAYSIGKRIVALPEPTAWVNPMVKSLFEAKINYNFFLDKNIEPTWMQFLPVEERAYESTPRIYSEISRWSRISPLKLQHILRQGISAQYDETFRMAEMIADGRMTSEWLKDNPADVPFAGRLFVRNPGGFSAASPLRVKRTLQKMESPSGMRAIQRAYDKLIDKYGEDAHQYEEFRALQQQLEFLARLKIADQQLTLMNRAIRNEMAKPPRERDWYTIVRLRSAMVKTASQALLQTGESEEK